MRFKSTHFFSKILFRGCDLKLRGVINFEIRKIYSTFASWSQFVSAWSVEPWRSTGTHDGGGGGGASPQYPLTVLDAQTNSPAGQGLPSQCPFQCGLQRAFGVFFFVFL